MDTQQPRTPRFSNEQVVSMLLAAAGIGVTLIGVVLLLAMAAREGMLVPPVRVAGGAVFAALLAGAAAWVRPRPGGRLGSVALLATASAAAFFDVVAVTRIYSWVPLTVGLALALVVAAAAGAQAVRWEEKYLFQAVVLSVAGLAPFLTGGINLTLVAFLAVLQLVGLLPELLKGWDATALTRTLPVVLAGFLWAIRPPEASAMSVVGSVLIVAVIGLGGALLAVRTRDDVLYACAALVLSWIPVWVAAVQCDRPIRIAVCAVLTLVAGATLIGSRGVNPLLRAALALLGGTSGLMLALACADGEWRSLPFLTVALVLALVHVQHPRSAVGIAAMAAWGLGVLVQIPVTPYAELFYRSRAAHLPASAAVVGAFFLAFAAAMAGGLRGRNLTVNYVRTMLVGGGVSVELGLALVTLTLGGGSTVGFYAGHLFITVMSAVLAAVVLTAGLRSSRHLGASIGWGLALVGCALAKLFLFDLHYMGAMTKAFTFLAVGVVLLAAGTAYARSYAEWSTREVGGGQPQLLG